ncbi:RrF2 family transcriptional regulator [Myxococcus qinghaiensis]|uniref:RrF2 family transcriptional regulator n=1 Tax=Myxococcus qinghaiensis TaxID=2906758 RepID=UPI0020A7847B|nr:Rrf2 family transcriptional regulator [Myxococcus qinghaiensis]MCP3161363.1 Rrf2 family transcriptional regulator [Myxococcus qinghaiensis]
MPQHPLQISRKIEYGLRAMTFLASQPLERMVPFREIARRMDVPEDFLAKILKVLVSRKLVRSTRGAHGGYALSRPAREVTFLDVIEAVEGPVHVNVCQDTQHDGCKATGSCTMYGVWKLGQQRMLDVYRSTTLDRLAMTELRGAPESGSPAVTAGA